MKIRELRIAADLSQSELAAAVGRTGMWVSLVEAGKAELSPESERKLLLAVERLAWLKQQLALSKAELTNDLRLPTNCSPIR